jgi:hypothetical protein
VCTVFLLLTWQLNEELYLAEHVAQIGEMCVEFWQENLLESVCFKEQDVDVRIMLTSVLRECVVSVLRKLCFPMISIT